MTMVTPSANCRILIDGKELEITQGQADGVIACLYGTAFSHESAPLGFAFCPDSDEWRAGYALVAFLDGDPREMRFAVQPCA